MEHIDEFFRYFSNLDMINNGEEPWDVNFDIDRTPDYNLVSNAIYEIYNRNLINGIQNFENEFYNDVSINNTTQSNDNNYLNNTPGTGTTDGFIPFQAALNNNTDNIPELVITDDIPFLDNIPFNAAFDFIPFQVAIETEVHHIQVSEEERECPICYETREHHDISQTNCGHKFCGICLIQHIRLNEPYCPLCRDNITHITFQTDQYNATFLEI